MCINFSSLLNIVLRTCILIYQKNLRNGAHTLLKSTATIQSRGKHNILLMYDKALLKLVHCCPKPVKCQRQPRPLPEPLKQQCQLSPSLSQSCVNKLGEGNDCRESQFENALEKNDYVFFYLCSLKNLYVFLFLIHSTNIIWKSVLLISFNSYSHISNFTNSCKINESNFIYFLIIK